MKMPWESAVEGITGVISEFVEDKDLAAKLTFETNKLKNEIDKLLLTTKTNPFVDGFVKVLIAFRDIILPMLRPVGAFYLSYMGIDMAQMELMSGDGVSMVSGGLTAIFPGWMGSRHQHKNKQEVEKTRRAKIRVKSQEYDDDLFGDD